MSTQDWTYDEGERLAKEQAERLMREQADLGVNRVHQLVGGTSIKPAAPLNDQIREIVNDLADAADLVAEKRQVCAEALTQLRDAEERYAGLSGRMAELLARHKAAGDPNATKGLR